MKITYTGKLEQLSPTSQKKLDARYKKLGKLLDKRGEKEAHVILNTERHLHQAEITVNYFDQSLIGKFAAKDTFDALMGACDRLEKQILKYQTKKRDVKRKKAGKPVADVAPAGAVAPEPEPAPAPKIFRANGKARKPMTVEEAALELNDKKSYVVFLDSETDKMSVLMRRPDGHFDLIES